MKALNCIWHINHFRCFQCNVDLGGSYVDVDGSPYCKQCYLLKNAPKCKGCNLPITGAYINAIGAYWHADCFACRVKSLLLKSIFLNNVLKSVLLIRNCNNNAICTTI